MAHLVDTVRNHLQALSEDLSSPLRNQAVALLGQWEEAPESADLWLTLALHSERLAKIHAADKHHDAALIESLMAAPPGSWKDLPSLPAPIPAQKKLGAVMLESVMIPAPADKKKVYLKLDVSPMSRYATEEIVSQAERTGYALDVFFNDKIFDTTLANALSIEDAEKYAAFIKDRNKPVTHQIGIKNTSSANVLPIDKSIYAIINESEKELNIRRRNDEVRWIVTYLPTEEEARLDDITYADYLTLFLEAADQPWEQIKKAQAKLISAFNKGNDLHITNSDGTNIRMSIEGHTFANSVIARNIPGSEIFSGPVRESVNGTIVANGTFCMGHHVMKNLRLTFENGLLTHATAEEGQEGLNAVLALDDHWPKDHEKNRGMRKVGEIGIGTNPHIRQHLANPLLVEKISGSFHIALGSAYGNSYLGEEVLMDNGNRASEHWDLTTILRGKEGKMYLDNHLIQNNGEWIAVPELGITAEDVRVLNEGWRALPNAQIPRYWRGKLAATTAKQR